jgi:hypothetical protein
MAPSKQEGVPHAGYAVTLLGICLAVFASACGGSSGPRDSAVYTAVGEPCNSSRLFAADSVWNACFPADAPVDSGSGDMVEGLVREVKREGAAGTGPYVQTDRYSTPLYVVRAHQPVVRVALDDPRASWRRGLQRAFRKVPIPKHARPAAGSDAHMTVWQPSRDRLWEFWQARKRRDGWHASWGGAIKHVSSSPGYFNRTSWPGLSRSNWGATATSLPVIAGTILISELRAGEINHALALDLPAPRSHSFAWPAQRTDGTGPPSAIPEGARLRLDPDQDLESLDLPRITLIMARAAQRYGMIVRDQTHGQPQAEDAVGAQRSNADSGNHPGVDAPRNRYDSAAPPEPPDSLSRALGDALEAGDDVELLRSRAM